jgi:hypothetical protein
LEAVDEATAIRPVALARAGRSAVLAPCHHIATASTDVGPLGTGKASVQGSVHRTVW